MKQPLVKLLCGTLSVLLLAGCGGTGGEAPPSAPAVLQSETPTPSAPAVLQSKAPAPSAPAASQSEAPSREEGLPPHLREGSVSGGREIFVTYDRGHDSLEELLTTATLIVRATPVSVESESDVALCWVLEVAQSSAGDLSPIRLRQMKDEHLLTAGQEVVLALQPDAGEGYYNIPGGGDGLFRSTANGLRGKLADELLDSLPATYGAKTPALSAEQVFELLVERSR